MVRDREGKLMANQLDDKQAFPDDDKILAPDQPGSLEPTPSNPVRTINPQPLDGAPLPLPANSQSRSPKAIFRIRAFRGNFQSP